MNRKTVKTILISAVVIVILMSTMIIADFNDVLHGQSPVFCLKRNTYDDGGTIEYIGLGYKIIDYNATYGREDIVVGSFFKRYDPQINESKLDKEPENKNKIYNFEGIVEGLEIKDSQTMLIAKTYAKEEVTLRVIAGTLIYQNDEKAKLTDVVSGCHIKARTSIVDRSKEIPEAIVEVINIIE